MQSYAYSFHNDEQPLIIFYIGICCYAHFSNN